MPTFRNRRAYRAGEVIVGTLPTGTASFLEKKLEVSTRRTTRDLSEMRRELDFTARRLRELAPGNNTWTDAADLMEQHAEYIDNGGSPQLHAYTQNLLADVGTQVHDFLESRQYDGTNTYLLSIFANRVQQVLNDSNIAAQRRSIKGTRRKEEKLIASIQRPRRLIATASSRTPKTDLAVASLTTALSANQLSADIVTRTPAGTIHDRLTDNANCNTLKDGIDRLLVARELLRMRHDVMLRLGTGNATSAATFAQNYHTQYARLNTQQFTEDLHLYAEMATSRVETLLKNGKFALAAQLANNLVILTDDQKRNYLGETSKVIEDELRNHGMTDRAAEFIAAFLPQRDRDNLINQLNDRQFELLVNGKTANTGRNIQPTILDDQVNSLQKKCVDALEHLDHYKRLDKSTREEINATNIRLVILAQATLGSREPLEAEVIRIKIMAGNSMVTTVANTLKGHGANVAPNTVKISSDFVSDIGSMFSSAADSFSLETMILNAAPKGDLDRYFGFAVSNGVDARELLEELKRLRDAIPNPNPRRRYTSITSDALEPTIIGPP